MPSYWYFFFKSHHAWQSYGLDMNRFHWSLRPKDKCWLTLTFDITTWFLFATHRLVMIIICTKLFTDPTMNDNVTGPTRTGFTKAFSQSLRASCDLDLWCNDVVVVCDKLSCHDDYLCEIIFKSHHAWQKLLARNKQVSMKPYAQSSSANCDLDLWPTVMFLFVTIIFVK